MSDFGKGSFGTGAYGTGNDLIIPLSNPPGLGYGGIEYGLGSYGGVGFALPSAPISQGYGGEGYGYGPYGSISDITPPSLIGAISIDGFHIELFFSEPMLKDEGLINPLNYIINPIFGAANSSSVSIEIGLQSIYGVTSVIVEHTGTTLGGIYEIEVFNLKDLGGSNIEWNGQNKIEVLCKGEPPNYTATPISGTEILLDFDYNMLTESDFSPGVESFSSYEISSDYPILPIIQNITQFVDLSKIEIEVLGMTSTSYEMNVGPASAIIYDGQVLPNLDSNFAGTSVGFGTSVINHGLLLSSPLLKSYGWSFKDISGRILPDSSYRVDQKINLADTTINNSLTKGIVFTSLISDGAIQVRVDFSFTNVGEQITVSSGGYSQIINQSFSNGEFEFSLVRNQKADTFTFIINGSPIFSELTTSFTGASGIDPGVRFLINTEGKYDIKDFKLEFLYFTSSQTVFSEAWNFLHNQIVQFFGVPGLVKTFIQTNKGPLVKGWGNATPATYQDVSVWINGLPIQVESVNPYVGKIYPTIPIPLLPPGLFAIIVDYKWMYNPVFSFSGLNTEGLTLNKYDPIPTIPLGITQIYPDSQLIFPIDGNVPPFAFGVVLNSVGSRKPLYRSSRFIAFQKAYTAALNSPNTLLLNSNPHIIKKPSESEETEGFTVFYEGTEDPTLSNPRWSLVGQQGSLETINDDFGEDTSNPDVYSVYDTSTGSFGTGQPSFYVRREEVPFSSSVVYVVRFVVTPDVILVPNGVFTGVGFGYHDNNHLYLVGALLINGLQHIGMLVQPSFPEEVNSWKLGYQTNITILNKNTFTTKTFPRLAKERLVSDDIVRFQILEGPQVGVYEITDFIAQSDGTFTISVLQEFPADPTLFGNRDATAVYEIRWDGDGDRLRPLTYRLVTKTDAIEAPKGFAELFVGGSLSGKALELQGAPSFSIPPDGVLLYPTGSDSEFFWGSLSRPATNSSDWNFVRYGVQPGREVVDWDGVTVYTDMLSLPENNPSYIWFVTQDFGARQIDSANRLLLKKTSSSNQEGVNNLDLTLGYSRFEPFFTRKISCTYLAYFQVDSAILGVGDAQMIIDDGEREVILATLMYEEENNVRSLVNLQQASLCGLLVPEKQGWIKSGDVEVFVEGKRIQFSQNIDQTLTYSLNSFSETPVTNNRIFDLRFRSLDVSEPNITGIYFGLGVGPFGVQSGIGARLLENSLELYSLANQVGVVSFPFDWNDGEIHSIRIIVDYDQDVVSVVLDDVVIGTAYVTSFGFFPDVVSVFGVTGSSFASRFELEDLSVTVLPPTTIKRTLGIFVGPNWDDINSWKVPRLDSNVVIKNSDLTAQIQEVDWTSFTKVSLHRDPTWGVVVQLPQLGLPPFYTGNFATQTLVPSSGWISVEYPQLPVSQNRGGFGRFSFGAFDSRSISQQRWDFVKYRIYLYPGKDQLAPQFNVLNRSNVITSGEWINDQEVETVTVLSQNSTTISLLPSNIYASQVFQLSYVNLANQVVFFYPDSFTFDVNTQTITIISTTNLAYQPSRDIPDLEDPGVVNPSLNDPNWPFLNSAEVFDPDGVSPNLPSPPLLSPNLKVPVTVYLAVGNPYTKTYICSQPLEGGSTLLNEDTPDYTKNLVCPENVSSLQWNSQLNNPWDLLQGSDPIILNDFSYLGFDNLSSLCSCQYENIEFCEVTEGEKGYLTIFCDNTVPVGYPGVDGSQPGDIGNGLIGIGYSGLSFTETETIGFSDGFQGAFANIFLHAGIGELDQAIIIPDLGDDVAPLSDTWSVIGYMYDTATNQTETIYFVQGE